MSRDILNLATFGVAGLVLGHKKSTPAPTPAAATPAVMPLPDDDKIAQARKRSIAAQLSRGGRDSTMLTPAPGTTLGG